MQVLRNGRGLAGPPQDLVRGAYAAQQTEALARDKWPFYWEVPHDHVQHVQAVETIFAPPNGVLTEITGPTLPVVVPPGFVFVLRGILQSFQTGVGGASVFVEGSGDIKWTVDCESPESATVALAGFGLPYLSQMKETRGSFTNGPWKIEGFNVFQPYQIIRYKVITTAAIAPGGVGVPNFITGGLFGWWEKLQR